MSEPERPPRERALEAMICVAALRGYEGITLGEVTERAGISREQFEAMFASKQACFLEAYDAVAEILLGSCEAAFEAEPEASWSERVTAGLRMLVDLLSSQPDIARMALVEISAAGEDARYRYGLVLRRFIPFLELGRKASPQGAELPPETARFALGGALTMVFDEIRAGRGAQLPRRLPDLVFTVTMPYLGAERAEEAMRAAA